jgi:uncharacterized protein (DUF488 family)
MDSTPRVLYTLGFSMKPASEFFGLLQSNGVTLLADIRQRNVGQLNGFTQVRDLPFFLGLFGMQYVHWSALAPSVEIRDAYKADHDFAGYTTRYTALMERRDAIAGLPSGIFDREVVCLLCSEPTAKSCHRRLAAEMIQAAHPGMEVRHL